MAREVESLVLQMSADIRRMEKALDQGQRKFDKTANAIEKRQRELDRNLANLGREAANFAAPVQAASAVALGAIVGFSINAAKRAEAVDGAFKQIFRGMPAEAAAAVSAISSEFGRLETDVKDNFSRLQGVLGALGVDAEQSLKIIDQLQRRSLDIGAFGNVSDAEAFQAVISGITGETEPLKRFGIVVNETATKAELLRLGFKGNAEQASEAAKAIARSNIIMKQSAEMHGQVSREADQLAEQEKRTRAEFAKAAEDFGQKFLPVAKEVLVWASNALDAFNKLPEGTQTAALGMLALVAASGPIAALVTGLRSVIGAAMAARAAIMAIPGSPGGGGKGGVAPIVGGRGLLGSAALGAGLVTSLGSFSRAAPADSASSEERLNYQRDRLNRLTQAGASATDLTRVRRQISALENEKRRVDALYAGVSRFAQPAPDQAARDALAGLGDFGLSDAQKMGAGGGGSGRRGSRRAAGPSPEDLAAQRTMLALQAQIELLQAQGRDAEAESIQRQVDILNLTKQYEAAGVKNAAKAAADQVNAVANAEAAVRGREYAAERTKFFIDAATEGLERQNEQMIDRLGYEAELARLSGDPARIEQAERALWIEEQINQILARRPDLTRDAARRQAEGQAGELTNAGRQGDMREFGRDLARDFVGVLSSDNIWAEAGQRFKDAAWDGVENMIAQLFGALGSGSGDGNWISALASFFTGGKRATGGPVTAGQSYLVGERRPEVFVPNTAGTIIPSVNAAMAQTQKAASYQAAPVVRLIVDEGTMFAARVQQISGPISVQTAGMGVAYAQDQQRAAATRRRQSFVGG